MSSSSILWDAGIVYINIADWRVSLGVDGLLNTTDLAVGITNLKIKTYSMLGSD